ncbi:MAG TPA: hypothetical protein VMH22_00010 [bacterium]|nr:hypothetical protein [bacterium]
MMPVQTRDFVNVAARARELGCRVPLAVALLPGNFSTAAHAGEFRYHPATPYIRSAWQTVNLHDEGPGISDRVPLTNGQLTPLVAFLGASLLRDDPGWRVSVALATILRVFASDPCCASPREVLLDVVVERPDRNRCACVEYRGDACELTSLTRAVQGVWAGTEPGFELPGEPRPGAAAMTSAARTPELAPVCCVGTDRRLRREIGMYWF